MYSLWKTSSKQSKHSFLILEIIATTFARFCQPGYPVGFVYGQMPGPEGYHFDCGCVLDNHGRTQRVRAPLENRHLHFVNFCYLLECWKGLVICLLKMGILYLLLWYGSISISWYWIVSWWPSAFRVCVETSIPFFFGDTPLSRFACTPWSMIHFFSLYTYIISMPTDYIYTVNLWNKTSDCKNVCQ